MRAVDLHSGQFEHRKESFWEYRVFGFRESFFSAAVDQPRRGLNPHLPSTLPVQQTVAPIPALQIAQEVWVHVQVESSMA